MTGKATSGGDLFIVDNSDTDWKVKQYLIEWAGLSHQFDIATGFFEIGALLAMDGHWQKLDKIRILMGDEVSKRTKRALLECIAASARQLDASIEREKERNDFLTGAAAIHDALGSRKIECRVYNKEKFHAKAYITHAKQAVVGSTALVGSSNFTHPGLTDNVELNVQIRREVGLLQEWYERHWNDAHDITPEILKTVERHVREYMPFDVYAKALHEYFRGGGSLDPDEWDLRHSKLFSKLDRYQQDGYRNLLRIAAKYNGALLCDGVGLGKTYIGLMLIERFAVLERKRVLLLVPKSGSETVWVPEINRHLGHINTLFGKPLVILNHTDLTAPSREKIIQDAAAEADVVIIDEAHNFRNIGTRGEFTADIATDAPARGGRLITGEGKVKPSRYRKLFELIGNKKTFLLTATPVNNDLSDLRHLIELFSRRRDDYFANHDIAIKNLRSYFNELKRRLHGAGLPADAAVITDAVEASGVLERDPLVSALVVQRSRGYVKESQKLHGGRAVVFPEREPPKVAEYSLKGVYGNLLKTIADAFHKEDPLFSLPMYQPLLYRKIEIDPEDQQEQFTSGRQEQIVALIRTGFLKRLESSAEAFRLSCHRLLIRLLAFIVQNVQQEKHKADFQRWQKTHRSLVDELKATHPDLFVLPEEATLFNPEGEEAEDDADDLLDPDLLAGVEKFDRQEFRVDEMVEKTLDDLDVVAQLLEEVRRVEPKRDAKLQTLIKLLKTDKVLKSHKVMIFSEFADTAEYLRRQLREAGIDGLEAVDGSHAARDRVDVVKRFAPYYNRSSSAEAEAAGGEIRVLISTDVLSEGLNLQDATRLINFDLHWNPVRLMQRIGRIDRRLNPEIEERLLADHPEQKPLRATACYWNFLPPDELNVLLSLYNRVTHKTLNISKTFGIEGKKLLRPEDDFDALKDFNASYERQTKVEELALEYEQFLKDHPGLVQRLDALPGRVFSGKAHPSSDARAVFFCYQLPTRIQEPWGGAPGQTQEFSEPPIDGWAVSQGPVRWYIYDLEKNAVLEPAAPDAAALIRCGPTEPRKVSTPQATLADARAAVDKHIKNTYLKQAQAPVTAPKPVLKCWMELC
ncbi:MAG: hypothetical protein KF902_02760 [Phycisphaeraceae bacterium]|nr:hypothetical protein [Phycisphaeraceae bacterium]